MNVFFYYSPQKLLHSNYSTTMHTATTATLYIALAQLAHHNFYNTTALALLYTPLYNCNPTIGSRIKLRATLHLKTIVWQALGI